MLREMKVLAVRFVSTWRGLTFEDHELGDTKEFNRQFLVGSQLPQFAAKERSYGRTLRDLYILLPDLDRGDQS